MALASIGPKRFVEVLAQSRFISSFMISYHRPPPWWVHGTKHHVVDIYLVPWLLWRSPMYHIQSPSGGNLKFATWSSFNRYLALWTIVEPCCRGLPCRTSLQLNQRHQAMVMIKASISSSKCWVNLACHRKSWNSMNRSSITCTPRTDVHHS